MNGEHGERDEHLDGALHRVLDCCVPVGTINGPAFTLADRVHMAAHRACPNSYLDALQCGRIKLPRGLTFDKTSGTFSRKA